VFVDRLSYAPLAASYVSVSSTLRVSMLVGTKSGDRHAFGLKYRGSILYLLITSCSVLLAAVESGLWDAARPSANGRRSVSSRPALPSPAQCTLLCSALLCSALLVL
jgi:hypothetical protein